MEFPIPQKKRVQIPARPQSDEEEEIGGAKRVQKKAPQKTITQKAAQKSLRKARATLQKLKKNDYQILYI